MTLAVLVLLASGAQGAPERAFVEVTAERAAYYVHEPIELALVFGVEVEFAATSMIQPFQRKLDVPVQLTAPWIEGLPGVLARASGGYASGDDASGDEPDAREGSAHLTASFVLNDDVALAERVEQRVLDGRTFTVLTIERTYLPNEPGELVVPAAILRFVYATRFEEDFVNGRTPVDRRDELVGSEPLALTIRALPEEGRPSEFTGAVGRLSVHAEVAERELAAGESFELVLVVEGQGNLELFAAPELDRLPGFPAHFHVLGKLEEPGRVRRVITYHLAPRSAAVEEVPPIRFAYFDTTPPASYRVVETEAIPVAVRPPRSSSPAIRPPEPAVDARSDGAPEAIPVVVALAVSALAVAAIRLARRRRARRS